MYSINYYLGTDHIQTAIYILNLSDGEEQFLTTLNFKKMPDASKLEAIYTGLFHKLKDIPR
jgi:hypothetical protein